MYPDPTPITHISGNYWGLLLFGAGSLGLIGSIGIGFFRFFVTGAR